jgi:hypothetical protein
LACKISLDNIPAPSTALENDYQQFRSWLSKLPMLKDKVLPESSKEDAWVAAGEDFKDVPLTGQWTFVEEVLTFWLKPLKIERSHRFGRRFGNDRFLAIGVPFSNDSSFPKLFKDNLKNTRREIMQFLGESDHKILGRTWKAFFLKDNSEAANSRPSSTMYFFAIDGEDFLRRQPGLSPPAEGVSAHSPMSLSTLLDWFIPFEQNLDLLSCKAFSRISLGMMQLVSSATGLIQ